jgi:hypothetical protein
MRTPRTCSSALLVLAFFAAAGCSANDRNALTSPEGSGGSRRAEDHSDDKNGDDNSGGTFTTSSSPTSSCVTAKAAAVLTPVRLVFMLDQSGSMGDPLFAQANPAQRWDPITKGLAQFFGDASSSGISASLQYFPANGANRLLTPSCNVSAYKTPDVPLTALPNASPFTTSFTSHEPLGATPTFAAVSGALDYAKDLVTQKASEPVAVVLVTDGEPTNCGTLDEVRDRITTDAATIKTYVIGVGDNLSALDTLAIAGGTGKATIINVQNPQQTSDDFIKALNAVRSEASCSVPLPASSSGALDQDRVNVAMASTAGQSEIVAYDPDCTDGKGWHYDDATAPKSIELCAASCDQSRTSAAGSLEVQFGCTTIGVK